MKTLNEPLSLMQGERRQTNRLILGDNLQVLKEMPNDFVDLIYLDPPFFSNRNYEVIWGDKGEVRSFKDRWAGGIDHYIAWLKERVEEMHRILKPTGSIFLHCDWHANAYIRVQILDRIFGENNFRNEIIWSYGKMANATKKFMANHDLIYFYTKTNDFIFKSIRVPFQKPVRRLKREAVNGVLKNARDKNGKIIYLESKDRLVDDNWNDIVRVMPASREYISYPTQKPEALLERIIKCSSNEGDLVFDPFMGGGTTIAVADKMKRQWIGIDQSVQAVKVTEFRLQKQTDLYTAPYTVQLYKYDYDTLRYSDAFEFESWIISKFGGTPQNKKGGDNGIDGKTADGAPIQVKRSDNIGVNIVKNFSVSAKQYDKNLFEKNAKAKNPVGFIIAFSFGKGAIEEAARLKNTENIIIALKKVEEIVPIALKPIVAININEIEKGESGDRKIEFIAMGESKSGIEFYSWDFDYDAESKKFNPQIIRDKEGRQIISLKTGEHNIAVKVVDNDGLENIEMIKLKINGIVKTLK